MKKALLAIASMGMMAAGMAAVTQAPSIPHQTEVRAAPTQALQPVAPKQSQAAIREQRSLGDAIRAMRIPVAHKNRTGGERANRRWRKARASGRS